MSKYKLFPSFFEYMRFLMLASKKYNITIKEASIRYRTFTYDEWIKELSEEAE